jgi:hypothetical protein
MIKLVEDLAEVELPLSEWDVFFKLPDAMEEVGNPVGGDEFSISHVRRDPSKLLGDSVAAFNALNFDLESLGFLVLEGEERSGPGNRHFRKDGCRGTCQPLRSSVFRSGKIPQILRRGQLRRT